MKDGESLSLLPNFFAHCESGFGGRGALPETIWLKDVAISAKVALLKR